MRQRCAHRTLAVRSSKRPAGRQRKRAPGRAKFSLVRATLILSSGGCLLRRDLCRRLPSAYPACSFRTSESAGTSGPLPITPETPSGTREDFLCPLGRPGFKLPRPSLEARRCSKLFRSFAGWHASFPHSGSSPSARLEPNSAPGGRGLRKCQAEGANREAPIGPSQGSLYSFRFSLFFSSLRPWCW